ncbi:MAG: WG repeat-containing protein [Psychroserpens sp.]|uniref:WG repeat-containing protein n=1 Tax=Psychroserpens sp. TaxID=2020870 RepID=UPI003001D9A4
MKKTITLVLVIALIPFIGFTQSIANLDYISPFHNDLAAIKKDGQWAFINRQGVVVIDFRSDLVITEFSEANYPVFKNDRCLIAEKRDDISYFGYINTIGNTVIQPQYLNASNFNDEFAIVLELFKVEVGKNEALGKKVVYDKYLQAIIDTKGNIKTYLSSKRVNVLLDKDFLKAPPIITSKYISKNLYAVMSNDKKWTVIYINGENNN